MYFKKDSGMVANGKNHHQITNDVEANKYTAFKKEQNTYCTESRHLFTNTITQHYLTKT